MKTKNAAIGAAAALLLLFANGCSDNSDATGEDVPPPAAVKEDEQGTITLPTQNGDLHISSVAERPALFPEEIPIPENAIIGASMEQPEKGYSQVVFDAELSFEEAKQLYKDFLAEAGYKESMLVAEEEDVYWYSGTRDTEQLVIVLSKNLEQEGWMSGSLTYQKAP